MATKSSAGEICLEIFQILNISFPSIPFMFQIKKFYDNKSSVGFSRKVSTIIIMASILRVFFWFGKRFHWTLLVQSILLMVTQIFVIHASIKFREGKAERSNVLLEAQPRKLYNWDCTISYLAFLVLFIILLEILSVSFTFKNFYFVETLGTISSILEAVLVIPQIVENCRVKATTNLSNVLVGCWILGDSMKTFYYFVSNAPIQLLISGFAQIFLDLIIVIQVFIYRLNKIDPKEAN